MADRIRAQNRQSGRGSERGAISLVSPTRELPEETPVALVYDGVTLAVMMATPSDLADFATGFTLTEGLTTSAGEVVVVRHPSGVECRMTLDAAGRRAVEQRRRSTTGGSSCGNCGIKSLAQAVRIPPSVAGKELRVNSCEVDEAVASLRGHQPLHDRTRATHAAGFFIPGRGLSAVREDVGRHNALDKLVGSLVRREVDPASGFVVLTSRVSIEMVQKVAVFGASMIVAVSAPTLLAARIARIAGVTLVCNVRTGTHEIITHAFRVLDDARSSRLVPEPRCLDDSHDQRSGSRIAHAVDTCRARTGADGDRA